MNKDFISRHYNPYTLSSLVSLPTHSWFRYSTGLFRHFDKPSLYVLRLFEPNKYSKSRKRSSQLRPLNPLSFTKRRRLVPNHQRANLKPLLHISSIWQVNYLNNLRSIRLLGTGPRVQGSNPFRRWIVDTNSPNPEKWKEGIYKNLKKKWLFLNKHQEDKDIAKISRLQSYYDLPSPHSTDESSALRILLGERSLKKYMPKSSFSVNRNFWARPYAYLNLRTRLSRINRPTRLSLIAKLKKCQLPTLEGYKLFDKNHLKFNSKPLKFVRRLKNTNSIFRKKLLNRTYKVFLKYASPNVNALVPSHLTLTNGISALITDKTNTKTYFKYSLPSFKGVNLQPSQMNRVGYNTTTVRKNNLRSVWSRRTNFRKLPVSLFSKNLDFFSLSKYYRLNSSIRTIRRYQFYLRRLSKTVLRLSLFKNLKSFHNLRRFYWSAPIRRLWRKSRNENKHNLLNLGNYYRTLSYLSATSGSVRVANPVLNDYASYNLGGKKLKTYRNLSSFAGVAKLLKRKAAIVPLFEKSKGSYTLQTRNFNCNNLPTKTCPTAGLGTDTNWLVTSSPQFIFFPHKQWGNTLLKNAPQVQKLLLYPLHSPRFKMSVFFFTNLINPKEFNTLDLVKFSTKSASQLDYLVFPDANEIKTSVFRRLNKQRNLLQLRTERLYHFNHKLRNTTHVHSIANQPITELAYNFERPKILNVASLWEKRYIFSTDYKKGIPTPRIRRIRFKPGYGRLWRLGRVSIREILGIKAHYQYRLTPKLQKHHFKLRSRQSTLHTFTLGFALMMANFAPDSWSSKELIHNCNVYLNGKVCLNDKSYLFMGDFIQLIVNLKFYLAMKWVRNWSLIKRNRVFKIFYRKFKPLGTNRNIKQVRTLPTWFFDIQYTYTDIPRYLELDYFTLSIFVIHNATSHFSWLPTRANLYEPTILNMYNWKYIT